MSLIKFTFCETSCEGNDPSVYISANSILSFFRDIKEEYTRIILNQNRKVKIKETPEEIVKLIGEDKVIKLTAIDSNTEIYILKENITLINSIKSGTYIRFDSHYKTQCGLITLNGYIVQETPEEIMKMIEN